MIRSALILLVVFFLGSCNTNRVFSETTYTHGFYYDNFKQAGSSVHIMNFFDLGEENSPTTNLNTEFIDHVKLLVESKEVKSYISNSKLGASRRLGFELCNAEISECFVLTDWAIINLSNSTQIRMNSNEVSHLWNFLSFRTHD